MRRHFCQLNKNILTVYGTGNFSASPMVENILSSCGYLKHNFFTNKS